MKKINCVIAASLISISGAAQEMTATTDGLSARMSNGIITLEIGSNGRVSKLYHPDNGATTNILGSSGIYFDYTASKNAALSPDKAEVVKLTDDYAEVLYSNTTGDLRFQQGYILRKGVSGVYTYVIANGTPASSSVNVKEARVCTRLASTFLDGYVDDTMQGKIPSNSEMKTAEKTENTIQDATYKMADGSIYTKYNWAQFIDSDNFHGLMNGKVGVWNIPVSYEWLNGGPMRQELTVHATSKSPITIQMLQGEHLGGAAQKYKDGEKQIFGPFLIYVNSGATRDDMIADAARMAAAQKSEWPFKWFANDLYPTERATVSGRIALDSRLSPARFQVVLGEPSTEIIRQGKKYIFWNETDADGNFTISGVRPGNYSLFVYALSGTVTEQLEVENITVGTGPLDLGEIAFSPADNGEVIWNIGENNRRADGFNMSDAPRSYGYWEKVPANLSFRIGESNERVDWYNAQCRNGKWTVLFNIDKDYAGDITLSASVAGSTNNPSVSVSLNGTSISRWSFPNNDAAVYRSATQAGRHVLKTLTFPATDLVKGENKLEFTMSGISKNGGVFWDCIKLEGHPAGEAAVEESEAAALPYEIYTLEGVKVAVSRSLRDLELPRGIYIYRHGSGTGKFIR